MEPYRDDPIEMKTPAYGVEPTPPGMDDNTSSGNGDDDAWGHTSNDVRDMHRLGKKQEVCLVQYTMWRGVLSLPSQQV